MHAHCACTGRQLIPPLAPALGGNNLLSTTFFISTNFGTFGGRDGPHHQSQTQGKKVEENARYCICAFDHFIEAKLFFGPQKMYQSISQFCWPDSKSNEANRGRHCAQEIVVSQQYINHLTKTIFPTELIESFSSISQWMTQASWLFSSSHFHSAQIKQPRGPPSRNQNT